MSESGTEMAAALGMADQYTTFAGRRWALACLDVNDLILLQQRIGGIEALDVEDMEHMRLFFWLILRKSDPDLTEEDRDNERYTLTERQVGRMLSLPVLQSPETLTLINDLLVRSGLSTGEATEADSKNARPAKPRK